MSEVVFPPHKGGLIISHNQHKAFYEKADQYLAGDVFRNVHDDAKARMIEMDSIWECQWYPDTPIGFYIIAAPTWDELVEAMRLEASAAQHTASAAHPSDRPDADTPASGPPSPGPSDPP